MTTVSRRPVVALCGPSAVGKGVLKERIQSAARDWGVHFGEPVVATTRPQRPDDGPCRRAGISPSDFEAGLRLGRIVLGHRPFGDDSPHQYGFVSRSLSGSPLLTEVHVSIISEFRQLLAGRATLVLGMIASEDVLAANLRLREGVGLDPTDFARRMNHSLTEIEQIQNAARDGTVDLVVACGLSERDPSMGALTAAALSHVGEL